ncbi:MAG TPA: prepilin-type N-terminal cleavage/methylation domain-containing protein [Phycisphaerae bacterium]|nr:prepilin-type N-terminal cleavage/methylation domain-containing protein [Phycisphaerae bacterium]
MGPARGAFTLVEILIVVVILAILAAIVAANFADIPSTVKETNLKENLSKIRAHIEVYRNQHADVPDGDRFAEQLTKPTNFAGDVTDVRGGEYIYGPYIEQMPANPMTGLGTIRTTDELTAMFPPGDQNAGWWYNEATGRFYADLADGVTDRDGQAYNRY